MPSSGSGRLSSSDVPRPAALEEENAGKPRTVIASRFACGGRTLPDPVSLPLSTAEVVESYQVDMGNARPRYLRLTVGSIPHTPDLLRTCGVPLALVTAPFADRPDEPPVPVVSAEERGPQRCGRCKAYLNPGVLFVDAGRSFVCNLCHHWNAVDVERYVPLDAATGLPVDYQQRLELQYGSVEYVVPATDYCENERTATPALVLVLDARCIEVLTDSQWLSAEWLAAVAEQRLRLGFVLCGGSALRFYQVTAPGRIEERLVPDLNDAFAPMGADTLLQGEQLSQLQAAVAYAAGQTWMHAEGNAAGSSCVAGILAAADMLRGVGGGKVLAVCAALPGHPSEAYALRDRWQGGMDAGAAASGKPKSEVERERALLQAAAPAYRQLGTQLADAQVSVDLFLFAADAPGAPPMATPPPYFDVATVSQLPLACGGRVRYYPHSGDVAAVRRDLVQAVCSVRAFEAVLRVRSSPGISPEEHLGSFRPMTTGRKDVRLPVMHTDSTLAVAIAYDSGSGIAEHPVWGASATSGSGGAWRRSGLLGGNNNNSGEQASPAIAYVQVAVLFTCPTDGTRRVRVHTLAVPSTRLLNQVFRTIDASSVLCWVARHAARSLLQGAVWSNVRDSVVERCVEMLYVYRRYCASRSSSGQLILPEALKFFPLYVLGLLKSAALRAAATAPDERAYRLAAVLSGSVETVLATAHPRMMAVPGAAEGNAAVPLSRAPGGELPLGRPEEPDPADTYGMATNTTAAQRITVPDGDVRLPPTQPLSSERLRPETVWLIEDGWRCLVWVGEQAAAGASPMNGAATPYDGSFGHASVPLPPVMMERLFRERPGLLSPLQVHRHAPLEPLFHALLIEDRGGNAPSYVEFLVSVHKMVQKKIASSEAERQHRTMAEWDWAHTY
ncbi:hypothetical protein CDCA_CDCA05G1530 [Cyanidium caldarium]|uniref:Uncharacterized protein n=1 Tax=Cyanidium caldarium TaxID=2771 RepID=A0AAV9IT84_CYACA|nr:hypothetical protein CDCA_CDCA05G1530 [Cyanidium caldarium]